MTEREAIKKLKYTKRNCGMPIQGDTWKPNAETIAIDMAISALEEIQQYRALGTVEELKEAKEKQIAKKPLKSSLTISTVCPNCREENLQEYDCDTDEFYVYDHCPDCGQRLDWSEI